MIGTEESLRILLRQQEIDQINQNYINFRFSYDPVILDDTSIVQYVVGKAGVYLQFASARLQDDEAIVRHAIKQDGMALLWASKRLQEDRELVLLAVQQNSAVIYNLNMLKFKNDPEIMSVVVRQQKTYFDVGGELKLKVIRANIEQQPQWHFSGLIGSSSCYYKDKPVPRGILVILNILDDQSMNDAVKLDKIKAIAKDRMGVRGASWLSFGLFTRSDETKAFYKKIYNCIDEAPSVKSQDSLEAQQLKFI